MRVTPHPCETRQRALRHQIICSTYIPSRMASIDATSHVPIMDVKDTGMFLVAVTMVALIALVGKSAYYIFSYFYLVSSST